MFVSNRTDNREAKNNLKKMVRPPCCDKEGVKKGPWTPEEDITLVSYIQEHGPGNWRAVPAKTGRYSFFHYVFLSLVVHMLGLRG